MSPGIRLKSVALHGLMAALWLAPFAYVVFLATQTTFLQGVYIASIRDMYFGCMEFVDQKYAYRMKSGHCTLENLEYRSTMTHDRTGFRNADDGAVPRVAVLGDSHAYGHGVNDRETFAALLASRLGVPVRNLALPAFATRRELEAYKAFGESAGIVIIQYCDNDLDENLPSLEMPEAQYQATLRRRMREVIGNYQESKSRSFFGQSLLALNYAAKGLVDARFLRLPLATPDEKPLPREADAFARLMLEYQPLLAGKTVVVVESSGWGRNRKNFRDQFQQKLRQIPQVAWIVLDSSALLDPSDYFRIDDHLNAKGHDKLARALVNTLRPPLALAASGVAPGSGAHGETRQHP